MVAAMLRYGFPGLVEKTPITWHNIPVMSFPMLGVYYMAYLARKQNTHFLRLLVALLVILGSFHVGFTYTWLDPSYTFYNMLKAYYSLVAIIKAIDFAVRSETIHRVKQEYRSKKEQIPKAHAFQDSSSSTQKASSVAGLVPDIRESMYASFAMRGLEYDWGKDIVVPLETRSLEREAFLRATFRHLLYDFLIIDFIDSVWKLFPPFQNPTGGSIFVPSLPWPVRYTISTVLHYSSATMVQYTFQITYDLSTIFGVLMLKQSPRVWPPIFDRPFLQGSVIDFWAVGWHQILRRCFLVCGGFPGQWISRKLGLGGAIGLLFGTFFGSGMFHEIPFVILGLGSDWRTPAFFIQSACYIFLERGWKRVTGRRVTGVIGVIWLNFSMGILGQNIYDSWHQRGYGSSMIVPPLMSPTRRILFPLILHIFGLGSISNLKNLWLK